MTAQALKQAALDHLAAENASACSLPLGDDESYVCVGSPSRIIAMLQLIQSDSATPPVDKDQL